MSVIHYVTGDDYILRSLGWFIVVCSVIIDLNLPVFNDPYHCIDHVNY